MFDFLDYDRSIAKPGFNRWLVPPAALAVHLSIGQVYAFSVFKIPLTRVFGITESIHDRDWSQAQLAWIFSIAIAVLGISAALFGQWLERAGPRKAMFASAVCFTCGFYISALGVQVHQLWLLYLGYGVVGGIGLGLGYIAPVSTLIKWFIDRPGMATGLAIMGFGGGAMIGGPLAVDLMRHFRTATNIGIVPTFLVMGTLYGCFILFGAFLVRVPPEGWKPAGFVPKAQRTKMISARSVDAGVAIRTPQFWLLWVVLCANVTAGIGVIEQASPMIQEMFKGRVNAAAAGGFVGLLSLFNMAGRFAWSTMSDIIGRKMTYMIFFVLGVVLYAFLPHTGVAGLNSLPLFVIAAAIIISMYGGGFATIPAYLRDMFGPANVSSIHGRLLTAWSVAGVLGPVLVNYLRQYQLDRHVPPAEAYAFVLYVMVGLLIVGLIANFLVRPVSESFFGDSVLPASRTGELPQATRPSTT
ncbi:MAG TPA: OFA family MFS transporter [Tepidisphaeraceae bacterium]|jgi:MFS family permease|nr:OFA family MFS transporter [Tepidisphaeraceae bacterium]